MVLAFLAFVAARILTWVKKTAQAPKGAVLASATHETLPKAFLHDLFGTTNWKRHRFEKPLTWLGRSPWSPWAMTPITWWSRRTRSAAVHAFIEYMQHDFWITDHDSVNGTFVNGRRIHAKARLKHGDHIRLGDCELTFEMPAMALGEETSVVGRSAFAAPPDMAADPSSFEPVAPFVAVEIQPAVAPREADAAGPEAPAPLREGVSITTSRPHGLKDVDDPTLPSKKSLKEDLKSYFEDS